ncbi:MAG: anhydro-N-acetylmuramic acid kinase [Gammaproteobacteria bacterium]|nr:MAG: anhydro-N-acetylmuramic acid kinase [Gammaproteobacteria bacterium]
MSEALFIGLISGTSRDGVDAVLVRFGDHRCELLASRCRPYPEALSGWLTAVLEQPQRTPIDQLGALHTELAQVFADATHELLDVAGVPARAVRAIGSHGQTIRHRPDLPHGFSLQLGDPGTLAVLTGIPVVADFRTADMAAGGQGAPLAPAFHRWAFASPEENRAVLNLGGIANVTLLPREGPVLGFDTGPANALLDLWIREQRGEPYDDGGRWAAGGNVDQALLRACLQEAFFQRPPPKSTGLELFNRRWLAARLAAAGERTSPRDVQATLAELTAITVARPLQAAGPPERLLVCGGGVHNPDLLARIAARLPGTVVESSDCLGIAPDWVEACAFAWLARERLAERPGNLPQVTGARVAVPLGGVYLPAAGAL